MVKAPTFTPKKKRDPVLVSLFGNSAAAYNAGVKKLVDKLRMGLAQVAAADLHAAGAQPLRRQVAVASRHPATGPGQNTKRRNVAQGLSQNALTSRVDNGMGQVTKGHKAAVKKANIHKK